MSDSTFGERRLRLDPFIFPSDTDFRFVLLMVAVLGASLFTYSWLYNAFFGAEFFRAALKCRNEAIASCIEPYERHMAMWVLGGVLLLFVVAVLIYRLIPRVKIWRDKLVPLSAEDVPEVAAYLSELCREVELPYQPAFLWNPLNSSSSGVAFGRSGRYSIALNGGLVMRFYTDRAAFRAIVLHELAHLRNADVSKTYFTVAIWKAFVIAALIPFGASLVYEVVRSGAESGFVANVAWRILPLIAMVYLTRNAVLRAREVYADIRASRWDGPAGALGRAIAALRRRKVGRWRTVLDVHPDPGERCLALAETHRLFRMKFWDFFGTGVVASIAFGNLVFLLNLLLPNRQSVRAAYGAALFLAPLVACVAGSGVWRSLFAALARNETPQSLGRLGVGLALGISSGQLLSFDSAIPSAFHSPGLSTATASFIFHVLWSVLLLAGLVCLLQWIATGASVWLEIITTYRSLRLTSALALAIASGLLTAWLGFLFNMHVLGIQGMPSVILEGLLKMIHSPLALVMLVSLWAFPLGAWFWRGRGSPATEPGWASLDSPSGRVTQARQDSLRPRFALIGGLLSGLAFSVMLLIARIGVYLGVPEAIRDTDEFRVQFYLAQVTLAALLQAGVAAVMAARVRRIGGIHGLFAAFAGGCLMATGLLGLNLSFGGRVDLSIAWKVFTHVVNGGALLSLPVAASIAILASRIRRFSVR